MINYIQAMSEADALALLEGYCHPIGTSPTNFMFLDINDNNTLKVIYYDAGLAISVVKKVSQGGTTASGLTPASYEEYIGTLTQTAGFDPVSVDLSRTISGSNPTDPIVFTRTGVGTYNLAKTGAFGLTQDKIVLLEGAGTVSAELELAYVDADNLTLRTKVPDTGALSDDLLAKTGIALRIYA
jgi:hypothetical protein